MLVLRVGEGDRGAYQELLQRYASRLYQFALRLTQSGAEAEDIVQETFVRLWIHAADYDPKARPTTWLHRIAHNLAMDRLRARRRTTELEDETEPAAGVSSQPALLDAKRRSEDLYRALAMLPERQSTAITLVHLQGLSGKEAAEVMGIGEEALESLLARGRRALKARLVTEKASP